MRLLLPARLSQEHAGQTGIESQTEEVQRWADLNGHTVVHVAADKKSGTVQPWDRPNLRPWVTEPDKIARYDAVIGFRLDRLTRGDNHSTNEIEDWAYRHGKQLLTVDGLVFPCEGADGIRWDVAKRIAHDEWLKTSERYRRMQAHLRNSGYLVGRPPFGYKIDAKDASGHKTLVPDPELVPYVKGMVNRFLAGDTLTSICDWLDSEGIKPSGHKKSQHKVWQQKVVRKVLSNPALIGRRRDAKGRTILKFKPILDMPTWERLQAALAASLDKPKRGAVQGDKALLAGIIHCAQCSRPMHFRRVFTTRKDGSRHYNYYWRCNGTTRDPSTCKNMIPTVLADSLIDGWVAQTIGRMELIERMTVSGHNHEDEIAEVKADIRDLDPEDPRYLDRHAELVAKLKELKELPSEPSKVVERPTGVTIGKHWKSLDTPGRRAWLLAGKITVLASKEPFQFSIEAMFGAEWEVPTVGQSSPRA